MRDRRLVKREKSTYRDDINALNPVRCPAQDCVETFHKYWDWVHHIMDHEDGSHKKVLTDETSP